MSHRLTTQTGFFESDSAKRLHAGNNPQRAEKSPLQHLIGKHKTILSTMRLLLLEAWQMHPRFPSTRQEYSTRID